MLSVFGFLYYQHLWTRCIQLLFQKKSLNEKILLFTMHPAVCIYESFGHYFLIKACILYFFNTLTIDCDARITICINIGHRSDKVVVGIFFCHHNYLVTSTFCHYRQKKKQLQQIFSFR